MKEKIKYWGVILIQAAIIFTVFYIFLWPVEIHGSSMKPTYESGNIVLVNRISLVFSELKQGDIVIVNMDFDEGDKNIIKRVVATGGDDIKIHDGKVYINNEVIKEDYIIGDTEGNIDIHVPENSVFIMGDNRAESSDSRDFGTVETSKIKGRVVFKLWPLF